MSDSVSPSARSAARSASSISQGVVVIFHAKSSIARCRVSSCATR